MDDQSADGTGALLGRIAARDRRVRIEKTVPPGGIVAALQLGCATASAPLLARMDADDVALPERLARQVAAMEAHPEWAVCGCGVRIAGGGAGFRRYERWLNSLTDPAQIAAERFVESPVAHPSAMIRRQALDAIGGYRDPPWAEDYDLWLRLLDGGRLIGKVPETLLVWRDHGSRLTRADRRYSAARFLAAKAHFLARLPAAKAGGVRICGAGPTGKRLARLLRREGIAVAAFYDINPRRIGEVIMGIPVLGADGFPALHPQGGLLIGAAGTLGARQRLRELAAARGFAEGVDFFCVK